MPNQTKSGNVKKISGISVPSRRLFYRRSSVILLTPPNAYLVWALTICIISTLIGFICYWVLIKRSAKSQQESFRQRTDPEKKKAISKPFQRMTGQNGKPL
ncbi:hypothetical protein O9992_00315 [Vibrio lentus]|nr:hypothetical protein [Vibrio lentus]